MSQLSQNQRVRPGGALFAKALALGLVLIFFGCESEPPQQKPASTVVRKKIASGAETEKASKPDAVEKKAPAQTVAQKKAPSNQSATPTQQKVTKAEVKSEAKKDATPESKPAQAPAKAQPSAEKESTSAEPAQASARQEKKSPGQPPKTETAVNTSEKSQSAPKSSTEAPKSGQKPAEDQGTGEGIQLARRPPLIVTDPFEPLFKEEKPTKKPAAERPERKRRIPQTPLEKIDLGQLKLTAIFRTPAGNKALVEEASGKGYIVEKGTWIGVHAGQVKKITNDAVVVEEEVENAIGEISLTERELKLQKPPGE